MTAQESISLGQVGDVLRSAHLLREVRAPEDVSIHGVCQDSREVRAGDLFLAWKGTAADGHDFVTEAAARGAVASVVERPLDLELPQLVVTGTNGKTTTAFLIRHLMGPGVPTAVIGTLGLTSAVGVKPATARLTTPGPVQISVWLRELADGGMSAVVIEASSHALAQHRLDAVSFDVVVFTNLSVDHLDYHASLGEYLAAKARLVDLAARDATVVVNASEPAWKSLDPGGRNVRTFAVDSPADVRASDIECDADGSRFVLTVGSEERVVRLPLVGRFNVENALAAVAAVLATGAAFDEVVERLATAPQVKGRMEAVMTSPFTVLIDFAHTPAGLEEALSALRPLTAGRLIVVFGAGGDRDRDKRLPMAEAVGRIADLAVITSDNPRSEDPEAILDALEQGLGGVQFLRITDRRQAIEAALRAARPGDTVVLAGKGHETEQVIGTTRHPFDEREVVAECLARLEVL